METDVNTTRKRENLVIRTALLVAAFPFFLLGITWLPVVGLLIGFALAAIALSPWHEGPLCAIKVVIGGAKAPGTDVYDGKESGLVPVAILTTSKAKGDGIDFDAIKVDVDSVRLGPKALRPVHNPSAPAGAGPIKEDVDGDGATDLIFYFSADDIGLSEQGQPVCITGETTTGEAFRGCSELRAAA